MSLSCYCDNDDCDWYYSPSSDFSVLSTKYSRKCCSCKVKIKPGDVVLEFRRWRPPRSDFDFIEESIHGDEVPLAPWFMCETCGGLYMSIDDLGFCCDISENVAGQIKEYREMEVA